MLRGADQAYIFAHRPVDPDGQFDVTVIELIRRGDGNKNSCLAYIAVHHAKRFIEHARTRELRVADDVSIRRRDHGARRQRPRTGVLPIGMPPRHDREQNHHPNGLARSDALAIGDNNDLGDLLGLGRRGAEQRRHSDRQHAGSHEPPCRNCAQAVFQRCLAGVLLACPGMLDFLRSPSVCRNQRILGSAVESESIR